MKKIYLAAVLILILTEPRAFSQNGELPPPKHGNVYVIAHRGAHIGIPENSLAAYEAAIEMGCDFVEIDTRTTKDNEIVSVHNASVDAYVPGKSGKVRDMTLAELKSLDIGKRFSQEWENTRIPAFKEILELCQGKIGIYLDLKDADVGQLISAIRKFDMEQKIVWYVPANRHKELMDIKQLCPKCMIMPDPGSEHNIVKVISAYHPKVIATDMGQLTGNFIKISHNAQVMVFTDDDEDDPAKWESEWKKIIDWGTDGIQTDQPELLIEYLKSHN